MKKMYWLACLGMISACGGGDENKPPTTTEVTLVRHDSVPYQNADKAFIEDYEKAHSDIKITPTTVPYAMLQEMLLSQLKNGTLNYDIVRVQPSWVCTFANQLTDAPADVLTASEAQNTFFAAPLAGSTCDGKIKGVPVEYNLEYGGLVVNMTKYEEKYGADSRPSWTTFADVITTAKGLAEYDLLGKPMANGLDIAREWPQPVKHIFFSQIIQRGGNYWNADKTFNFSTQQAKDSLTDMVKWVREDKIMHTSLIPKSNTFVTNRLVSGATDFGWNDVNKPLSIMGYVGTWGIANINSQKKDKPANTFKYEYVTHPPFFGTEHKFVQNSGWALVVPKSSKNQKAAWNVIKALAMTPEAMRKWASVTGSLPALKANGTADAVKGDPKLERVQPLLEKGQWVGYIPGTAIGTVEGSLMSNFFEAVEGTKTIDQALEAMQKACNDALAAAK